MGLALGVHGDRGVGDAGQVGIDAHGIPELLCGIDVGIEKAVRTRVADMREVMIVERERNVFAVSNGVPLVHAAAVRHDPRLPPRSRLPGVIEIQVDVVVVRDPRISARVDLDGSGVDVSLNRDVRDRPDAAGFQRVAKSRVASIGDVGPVRGVERDRRRDTGVQNRVHRLNGPHLARLGGVLEVLVRRVVVADVRITE
jgi:hypothetical protein